MEKFGTRATSAFCALKKCLIADLVSIRIEIFDGHMALA